MRSSGGTDSAICNCSSQLKHARASGLNTAEVREWARVQNIEVKDRGRGAG